MDRTDNKRTTERDRGDLQQPAVNRNRHTTPVQRKCATGVKPALSDMYAVTV